MILVLVCASAFSGFWRILREASALPVNSLRVHTPESRSCLVIFPVTTTTTLKGELIRARYRLGDSTLEPYQNSYARFRVWGAYWEA